LAQEGGVTSMDYVIHLLILVCIYLLLAQSFNFPFGVGFLFNLAHVALYAVGAYTTALLSTEAGVGFFGCIIASMTLGGVFSILLGAVSLRLSHEYYAIGTLALNSVVVALLINWKSLTRGVLGVPGIPRRELFGIDYYQNTNFLYLISILVVISFAILYFVFKSPLSRSLKAQAEHEYAALSLGRHTPRIRMWSFMISSLFAALAGSMFAYYINYIDPSSFSLTEMVNIIAMVLIGKPGSFWGVTAATIFLVLLPEPLRFIDIPPSILGPMRQLLYAVLLFIVVYVNRAKIFPVTREV
jgi:branched-chain amino acid transport system permease protein